MNWLDYSKCQIDVETTWKLLHSLIIILPHPEQNIYNYEIITTNFYYELDILVQLMEAANLCTIHPNRVTVMQMFSIWLNVSMELDYIRYNIWRSYNFFTQSRR